MILFFLLVFIPSPRVYVYAMFVSVLILSDHHTMFQIDSISPLPDNTKVKSYRWKTPPHSAPLVFQVLRCSGLMVVVVRALLSTDLPHLIPCLQFSYKFALLQPMFASLWVSTTLVTTSMFAENNGIFMDIGPQPHDPPWHSTW